MHAVNTNKPTDGFGDQKVVLVTNNGDIGGGEVMLLNIATALRESGKSVTVVAPSQPGQLAEAAQKLGFDVEVLPTTSRLSWLIAIRAWRSKNSGGILWCNGLLPAFATAFQARRIVHLHQRPVGPLRFLAFLAKFRSLVVLVPSESMKQAVRGSTVLPNWVSDKTPQEIGSASSTTLKIGFIGRLATIKGIDVLAQAMRLEPLASMNVQLVVAGEPRFTSDEDSQRVAESLKALGERVRYLGWVTPQDFLKEVDLVCCPSVWQEPFGLVVAEAMSAGKPVVASRVGGIPEILGEDYKFLVEPGNPEVLAQAIGNAILEIRNRPEDVHEMTSSLRARWSDLFSPDAGRRAVGALLDSLEQTLHS